MRNNSILTPINPIQQYHYLLTFKYEMYVKYFFLYVNFIKVIQRRENGFVNFNRSWSQYNEGFGFLSTEFWLGNEKLSYLTNQAVYELRVDVELSNGASFYTKYNGFRITDEFGQYKLGYIGAIESNTGTLFATNINLVHFNHFHDGKP